MLAEYQRGLTRDLAAHCCVSLAMSDPVCVCVCVCVCVFVCGDVLHAMTYVFNICCHWKQLRVGGGGGEGGGGGVQHLTNYVFHWDTNTDTCTAVATPTDRQSHTHTHTHTNTRTDRHMVKSVYAELMH